MPGSSRKDGIFRDTEMPNGLLILIDSLRRDIVADPEIRRHVAPTLDALIRKGGLHQIVAQASNTQFVMPSILSGTAPLDHGGYNDGCKNRPSCFTETIRAAGFETALFSNCVLYNRDLGFDRGFNRVCVPSNTRRALMQDIEYRLLEPVHRWRRGEMSDSEISALLQREFGEVLDKLIRIGEENRSTPKLGRSARINRRLARDAVRERRLLERDPLKVAEKLASIPEAYYYAALGDERAGLRLLTVRVLNKAYRAIERCMGRIGLMRRIRFGHFDSLEPLIEEVIPAVEEFVGTCDRPWFMMLHVMDVHSHVVCLDQVFRAPMELFRRYLRKVQLRRVFRAIGRQVDLSYLVSLSVVDRELGKLLEHIGANGHADAMSLMVIADHGTTLESVDGRTSADLTRRFFRTDLETPLIFAGREQLPSGHGGLWDSRDVGATLLHSFELPIPEGYDGRPIQSAPPRDYVVSENAGRNFCDLDGDDLNFAITGETAKLFAVLHDAEVRPTEFYNLSRDPDELENLVDRPESKRLVDEMLQILPRERGDILKRRGVQLHNKAAWASASELHQQTASDAC